ncbi:MAG: hypothetical protein HYX24_01810 [Candidatus Aenigmarchaeota archaeon]|nr:hypothetical protein [Candidatus Aenigmarchaeota archaeon]
MALMLSSRKHLAVAVATMAIMVLLSVYIPVLTIPGNTIEFQLSLLTWDTIILTLIFSGLVGISIGMHAYVSAVKISNKGRAVIKTGGTGFVGVVATLFAGKLCPLCLATIFGLLGLGASSALFVFSYKAEIMALSLVLLLASIYLAGRRISACENCKS